MFRTAKFSSSGRTVYAVLWYLFHAFMKQSGRWQDVFGTIKLHVQIFLRMNNLDVRNKSKTYLLTYLLTDLLTPWSRVLLENLFATSQIFPRI